MREELRPQYAKKFRCIGGNCEDNCCHAWKVGIDKASYKRYQTIPALWKIVERSSVVSGTDGNAYAVFKPLPSSNCVMLMDDGLCRIQKEFGEDYLPKTCATYPRVPRRMDGLLEWPLQLSCPEAARLVLLNPQLMPRRSGFTEQDRYARLLALAKEVGKPREGAAAYFWEEREFSLMLVQDRRYPVWQRLFILGMFCKRLDEVSAQPQGAPVAGLLSEYAQLAGRGDLCRSLDGIAARPDVQLRMMLDVVNFQSTQDPRLSRFRECFQDFLNGLGEAQSSRNVGERAVTLQMESGTRHYCEAYERYYAPFMERHPYLLENYLINKMILMGFPHRVDWQGQELSSQQQFVLMCVEFATIKALLIGMAGHYREAFGTAHVLKLVQVVAKSLEHAEPFRRALNWQGLADSRSIAALLKN